MSAKKSLNMHDDFHMGTMVRLETNLTAVIQIYNAVLFVKNNKAKYLLEVNDCEDCFKALDEFINYAEGLIETAEQHRREEHTN